MQRLRGAVASSARPTQTAMTAADPAYADVQVDFASITEIPDYHPPIRVGASKPDLDGNLWILPTMSTQSRAGELIYDVANNGGRPFFPVRLPVGRSVVGFGHGGVVYLMSREADGWHLERTKLSGVVSPSK
ncbi:MAG: hypothetical protein ABJB66_20470 [Gemmatimonadaceae bacterium]